MPHAPTLVPTIVSVRQPQDVEIVLRFDPRDAPASTEILIGDGASLSSQEYLALVKIAAARLAIYCYDYEASAAREA